MKVYPTFEFKFSIVRKTLGLVKYFIYLCRIKSLNL